MNGVFMISSIFLSLMLLAFAVALVGLFIPRYVTPWIQKPSGLKAFFLYLVLSIVFFISFGISADHEAAAPRGELVSSSHASQSKPIQVMNQNASISATTTETENGKAVVSGKTSLPTGTELMISLSNDSLGVRYEDTAVVQNGIFRSAALGPDSGLASAVYSVDVLMPLPSTQPKSVQEIIGSNGEHLTGPLVEKTDLGGPVVEFKTSYSVGSESSQRKTQSLHRQKVEEIKKAAFALLEKGENMEPLRNSANLADIRECGIKMRKYQKEANQLRSQADSLSSKYFNLQVATSTLGMCVSCLGSGSAMESCDRTEKLLNEAQ
jgi:hypothetical protein